jgi:hypothetical protein
MHYYVDEVKDGIKVECDTRGMGGGGSWEVNIHIHSGILKGRDHFHRQRQGATSDLPTPGFLGRNQNEKKKEEMHEILTQKFYF